jgi:hypothetical protein
VTVDLLRHAKAKADFIRFVIIGSGTALLFNYFFNKKIVFALNEIA